MVARSARTDQWVEKVLSLRLPDVAGTAARRTAPDSFPEQWEAARAIWDTAIETVDGQIAALQTVLRARDNEQLRGIADSGLNAITGNHKVKLMAAIMDVTRADAAGRAAACAKARQLALDFGLHISTDPRVAACDNNPFGLSMSVAATLGPALARLETVLDSGAAP